MTGCPRNDSSFSIDGAPFLGVFFLSESGIGSPEAELSADLFTDLPGGGLIQIREQNLPPNWSISDVDCTSTTGGTNFNYIGGDEVQFFIAPGDDVRCTFTNESPPNPLIFRDGLETVP